MGPKQCGKSTLIRSLVKLYSSQNLTTTTGPITCIAGRQRRVTFFECPDDIYAMTDLAKVADLVLLMVDASYGFEMDTFEFLNQLQLHGFPKVIGVLTHLDKFKVNKSLQKAKKAIKHRFWTEVMLKYNFIGQIRYFLVSNRPIPSCICRSTMERRCSNCQVLLMGSIRSMK